MSKLVVLFKRLIRSLHNSQMASFGVTLTVPSLSIRKPKYFNILLFDPEWVLYCLINAGLYCRRIQSTIYIFHKNSNALAQNMDMLSGSIISRYSTTVSIFQYTDTYLTSLTFFVRICAGTVVPRCL